MIPKKLKKGDHLRVIAPSESFFPKFTEELENRAVKKLEEMGLKVSFGKYVRELNEFDSASVEHRLEDLHDAFKDPSVQAVISANGGASVNQLLKDIDYDLIKNNPKILCGLSDLTELALAVYHQAGLVTYYGPHFSMLGAAEIIDPSYKNMEQIFFSEDPVTLKPAEFYNDSAWDKEKILNDGFWTINEGEAEAECLGGNLLTINFSLGSRFMPPIEDKILFIEENSVIDYKGVQKEIQELLNHPSGESIKGIIIGRFQKETQMNRDLLTKMIKSKKEWRDIPVVGNVDCSHTAPMMSMPIGGKMKLSAKANDEVEIVVTEH